MKKSLLQNQGNICGYTSKFRGARKNIRHITCTPGKRDTSKTLLLDVDNTLLDYDTEFRAWASNVYEPCYADFNQTIRFGLLPPLVDAQTIVPRLKSELGYDLVIVTACGVDDNLCSKRIQNLEHVFGPIFQSMYFIPLGESKDKVYCADRYANSIVVDDIPEHLVSAFQLGMNTAMFRRPHNDGSLYTGYSFHTWEQFYNERCVHGELQFSK